MRRTTTTAVLAICVAITALVSVIYLLFHGYFDAGKFEIKQAQWSSSKQVAVLAKRSDQHSLGGLTYFVLLGDHLFTPAQLRHAYHSRAVVFAATDNCLDLRWQGPTKLVIACNGHSMPPEYMGVQKHQEGEVTILYENIPNQ